MFIGDIAFNKNINKLYNLWFPYRNAESGHRFSINFYFGAFNLFSLFGMFLQVR